MGPADFDAYRPGRANVGTSSGPIAADGFICQGVKLTTGDIGTDVLGEFAGLGAASGTLRFGVGEDNGPAALQIDFVVMPPYPFSVRA